MHASVWREGLELLAAVVGLDRDRRDALGELERGLDRVGDPPADVGLGDQPVDHDLDRVLVGLGQPDRLGQVADLAVDARPREPLARQVAEQLLVLALAAPDDGRQHLEPRALGQLDHLVDDLLGRLAADRAPAVGAVRVADPRVQHAEVVVDLGDGADGGARVPAGGLLVDRDGRREPLDEVDVGLLHLPQELPGVRRQRLHVPPLALGVDRVEGERGLPGAGQAREHDQLVTREVERDVLEVVLTGAVDDKPVGAHTEPSVEASADTTSDPYPSGMDRDLRQTPVYRDVEAFFKELLEPAFGTIADLSGPRASPDGTMVACTGSRLDALEGPAGGHARVCVVPVDGSGLRQLTDGPNDDAGPQWSPDGSTLTFLSDRAAAGRFQLYALETDALGEARLLTAVDGVVEHHAVVARRFDDPDGGGRDQRRTGRRPGLGHPGRSGPGRGSGAALAPRGGVLRRRRRTASGCGSSTPAPAKRGRSAGRTSTSGRRPGAATT